MAIRQVSVLDVLRGLAEQAQGEFYVAREQLVTSYEKTAPSIEQVYVPPPLRGNPEIPNSVVGATIPPALKITVPGFIERNFWPIFIFLLLLIAVVIWLCIRENKKESDDEKWERLKKSAETYSSYNF